MAETNGASNDGTKRRGGNPKGVGPIGPGRRLADGRVVGRQKGSINQIPRLIKDALMMAVVAEGDVSLQTGAVKDMFKETTEEEAKRGGLVGYLRWLARVHPQCTTTLLARLMPLQVQIDGFTQSVYDSVEEVEQEMVRNGVSLEAVQVLMLDDAGEYSVAPDKKRSDG